ncbi:MAG: hypothetical protein Q7S19_00015 [bacterium]|nr:hypothetical protein [bacterium]
MSADKVIANISSQIVNPILAVMFGFALLFFLYGMLEFIQGGANEKAVETGKRHMVYGILGLVVMVGARGIVDLIIGTINSL